MVSGAKEFVQLEMIQTIKFIGAESVIFHRD